MSFFVIVLGYWALAYMLRPAPRLAILFAPPAWEALEVPAQLLRVEPIASANYATGFVAGSRLKTARSRHRSSAPPAVRF
jgi:hypothetical protein